MAFAVAQRTGFFHRQCARKHPAAQAANPEAGRFLCSENDEFEGPFRLKAALLESAQGFKSAEDAHHSVVPTSVWNRVNVRASGDRGKAGVYSGPTRKKISNRIFTPGQADLLRNI